MPSLEVLEPLPAEVPSFGRSLKPPEWASSRHVESFTDWGRVAPGDRKSVRLLASYLSLLTSALEAGRREQLDSSAGQARLPVASDEPVASGPTGSGRPESGSGRSRALNALFLLAALVGSLVALRLTLLRVRGTSGGANEQPELADQDEEAEGSLHGSYERLNSRGRAGTPAWRRFWAHLWPASAGCRDSSGAKSGHMAGLESGLATAGSKPLRDTPPTRPEPPAGAEGAARWAAIEGDRKCSPLEPFARRLASLLAGDGRLGKQQRQKADQSPEAGGLEADEGHNGPNDDDADADDDEARLLGGAEADGGVAAPASRGLRSSRSYIRSLVEVLARARAQLPAGRAVGKRARNGDTAATKAAKTAAALDDDDDDDDVDDEDDDDVDVDDDNSGHLEANRKSRPIDDCESSSILVSQMDISAAHLILDYMEKHLDDKERIKREWRELNQPLGSTSRPPVSPGQRQRRSEAEPEVARAELALTLRRQARVALSDENRNKNRNCNIVPFDSNRVRLGQLPAEEANSIKAARRGDYINASYIYDDDPRRPTHIIAQGPTEQTCGHFWQMIWENGISVIVMLTRLSENGSPMCHCYWPTNCAEATSASSSPPELQRRGSVTSVFNGSRTSTHGPETNGNSSTTSGNGHTSGQPQTGSAAPIVANSELSNNMLYFDIQSDEFGPFEEAEASPEQLTSKNAARGGGVNSSSPRNAQQKQRSPRTTYRLEVHLISEHVSSSDYLVRNIYLINRTTGESRTLTQFHYLAWPKNGVPEKARSLLNFRRKVHKSYRSLKSPILVHCSEGAGRSGTFTLIDIILERIRNGAKEIDPRATLEHLRDQRVGLCANQHQFEFVLLALAEEIQLILNALPR